MKFFIALAIAGLFALTGCNSNEKTLKIAATSVPHAELLEAIKPDMEKEGINLKIIEVDDYNLPNRLLFEKQIDANFFQHKPYLDEQNARFGYNLTSLASVHIEPLGIYSEKITSINDLKEGGTISIPSDPTNEARALDLLAEVGLIKIKAHVSLATIYDIEENPKRLKMIEVDAAFLPRSLEDVDLAVIPANFALQANLNPEKNALVLESSCSPFANIVVVREGEEDKDEFQKLKKVLHSEKMRRTIEEKYHGAVLPAF